MTAPAVSVVVTAYHRTRYLENALATAIWRQTRRPEEVLIVEENMDSPVPMGEERTYMEWSTTVRRVNGSFPAAGEMLCYGLLEAKGDVVCFLDDDDEFLPYKVARVSALFERHPEVSYVRNGVEYMDEQRYPMTIGSPLRHVPSGRIAPNLSVMNRAHVMLNMSCISMRRERYADLAELLLPVVAGTDLAMYSLNLLSRPPLVVWHEPEPLSRWRVHSSNTSAGKGEHMRTVTTARYLLALSHGNPAARRFALSILRRNLPPAIRDEGRVPSLTVSAAHLLDTLERLSPYHVREWARDSLDAVLEAVRQPSDKSRAWSDSYKTG